jgi:PAS domain S-box-containing protein
MSIRQKFVALLLFIGLVPTLAVSILAFVTISNEINARTVSQLSSIDIKQQQRINVLLQSKQEEVVKLSNSFDFQTSLGNYLTSRSASDLEKVRTLIHDRLTTIPGVKVINVSDLSDTIIASTMASREGTKLQFKASQEDTAEGAVITIMEDKYDNLERLFISTKLNINKKNAAALHVVFRIDDLTAAIKDYTGLGSTGETMVLTSDSGGKTISVLPLRFNDKSRVEVFGNLQDGKATDYRGKEVMISSRSLGFSNWGIAAKIDTEEALAPIYKLRVALFLIVVVSSAAIVIVALYFTRIFTGPILLLSAAAGRIGKGNFDDRINLHRSDELGTLGDSINAMGASLKSLVTGIEAERNHLSVILNSTNDTIIAVDRKGVITTANSPAAELTGLPVSELAGKKFSDVFFHLQSGTQPFSLDFTAPSTNTFANIEYVNAGGLHHYCKLMVAALEGDGAENGQTIITIHDQTKSRELEDMKVDFVSMAAHELRTPLAAIRGYLELINLKLKEIPPEVANYIQQSLRSVVELGALINNLLDVSRIERGTLTLNMVRIDLAAIMSHAIKDVSFVADDKQINLHFDGPEKDCFVAADEVALKEVITNLLTNAVKYTPEGGNVEATLSKEGDTYRVTIKDSGIGIPKDAMPHLFTKFFRVKGGLASGSSGTGLGLFIAKSIVERHNGTIKAESEIGKGSTFSFTIPVLTPERLATMEAGKKPEQLISGRHRGWITKNTSR